MAPTPPSNQENSQGKNVIEISHDNYGFASDFLKEHASLKEIIAWVRDRFTEITENLRREEVNKHDLSHQMRTAYNSVNIMHSLGSDYFTHREMVLAGIASVIHDVGYINGDDDDVEESGYNSGNKGKYKKHALEGANEVKRKLHQYLKLINGEYGDRTKRFNINEEKIEGVRKMLTYKDEDGEERVIDEDDIEFIWGAILHHNDYGKDVASYNPWMVDPSALIVQLCDKLDHCRQRIYKEHLRPEDFVPDNKRVDGSNRDSKYYHRSVPYCIQDYKFLLNEDKGRMTWVADVDLDRFNEIMKDHNEQFYTPESFAEDFHIAYEKSARVAAEAMGVIFSKKALKGKKLDFPTLVVELKFGDGSVFRKHYERSEREIYNPKPRAPWQEELSAYAAAEEMHLVVDEEKHLVKKEGEKAA